MAAIIKIVENGESQLVSDIAPYVAEARAIEDQLATYFRQDQVGDFASLEPSLAEMRKLDARRTVLEGYFDLWRAAERRHELFDLKQRVENALAARPKS